MPNIKIYFWSACLLLTVPYPDHDAVSGTVEDSDAEFAEGSIVEIADNTLLLVGARHDFEHKQAEPGNAVLYRDGDTLYLIDSGARPWFLEKILEGAERLGPARRVVLINTHNHMDHHGNNHVIFQIDAEERQHFMSYVSMPFVADQVGYYTQSSAKAVAYAPGLDGLIDEETGRQPYWEEMMAAYDPQHPSLATATALESMPLQPLDIRGVREFGWNFDDAVYVLPSRTHTAGSVVVYFPKTGHITMGDETNRAFHVFHSADNKNAPYLFERMLRLHEAGALQVMSGGHLFKVYRDNEIRTFFEDLINSELAEQEMFLRVLGEAGPRGYALHELLARLEQEPLWNARYGGVSRVFPIAMVIILLKRLEEVGAIENGAAPDTRFSITRATRR